VLGVSAGGPYALACAWALADRLRAAAVVSSVVPASAPSRGGGVDVRYRLALIALARAPRPAARLADGALRLLRRHPAALAGVLSVSAPPTERALLAEREAREIATRSFLVATERGTAPMIEDYLACHRDWGFEPGAALGRVHLWHGALDRLIPVEHARHLGGRCQTARGCRSPGMGTSSSAGASTRSSRPWSRTPTPDGRRGPRSSSPRRSPVTANAPASHGSRSSFRPW
jgi:pimeloyl-ACP methyl ester carboxylesterase